MFGDQAYCETGRAPRPTEDDRFPTKAEDQAGKWRIC
jgi:hypothetical protein